MIFKRKVKIPEYNKQLAMEMAICADRDFRYGGDEETHDRNIMAIA